MEPVAVGASWLTRGVAVVLTGGLLGWGVEADGGLSPVDWFFLAWGLAFWAYLGSRLALARVGADASGVWIRGFLGVRRLAWDDVRGVEPGAWGVLEISRAHGDAVRAGAFVPPSLYRLVRRPVAVQRIADSLSLMARHPELRPKRAATGRELGPPLVLWALGALSLVAVDWLLVG
ncbi:PH domain-containing protein [Streptomyces sp. NPDC057877]|uniref:PH domain-containing protein n=1 Tax=Streptomyces sp. NPDC057877 TaxID=3346269 RepID=UPI0036AFAFDD